MAAARQHLIRKGVLKDVEHSPKPVAALNYLWRLFCDWAEMQGSLPTEIIITQLMKEFAMLAPFPLRGWEIRLLIRLVKILVDYIRERKEAKRDQPTTIEGGIG